MSEEGDQRGRKLVGLISGCLLAALVGLYFVWPDYREFFNTAWEKLSNENRDEIREWVESFGMWAVLVILGLMLLQTLIPFLPSLVMMVVSVLAYGPWWGGLLAWAGLGISAALGYGMGRMLGPVILHRFLSPKSQDRMQGLVEDYGFWGIVVARISPVLSTDAMSIVGGMVEMKPGKFFAATLLGTLPLVVLIAWLGEGIERLEKGLIWISAISLLTFAAYVWWDRRKAQSH